MRVVKSVQLRRHGGWEVKIGVMLPLKRCTWRMWNVECGNVDVLDKWKIANGYSCKSTTSNELLVHIMVPYMWLWTYHHWFFANKTVMGYLETTIWLAFNHWRMCWQQTWVIYMLVWTLIYLVNPHLHCTVPDLLLMGLWFARQTRPWWIRPYRLDLILKVHVFVIYIGWSPAFP